jgi:hypothetical protein
MCVRARENPMFPTALSRVSHIKVVRLGGSTTPSLPPSFSTPLSDLKMHMLGAGCDLGAHVMAALTVACVAVTLRAP